MVDASRPDFTNTPASATRPVYEYRPRGETAPLVSVITPYYNVGPLFQETIRAVQRMSFAGWEWLIVDDGSTDEDSREQLDALAAAEPRVRVIRQANAGPGVARNRAVAQARGRYLLQLDADDMVEPTFVEKGVWLLETQPQFAACGSYNVTFGTRNLLWPYGFQQYEASLYDNKMTSQALIRRDAWIEAGGYDERISYEHADWDFWLNLAEAGLWGYTIEEYLTWYRQQEASLLVSIETDQARAGRFRTWLHAKHRGLRSRFPHPVWRRNASPVDLTAVAQDPPFANPLVKPEGTRRVLLLGPWLDMGGADNFNLELIRTLSRRAYEFTVATTAFSSEPWLSRFTALTPDVFCLHRFLDVADYPRFIAYLIESRQIDAVLVTGSEIGYALLPYLRARYPHLALLDFNHLEEPHWLDGGHPAVSVRMQRELDVQVTCTEHLKRWMIARGNESERIQVQHCNIDTSEWAPERYDAAAARTRLGLDDDLPLILFVGRLVEQKRPLVFGQIIAELATREPRFLALVVGTGPEEKVLRAHIARHGLQSRVRFMGSLPNEEVRALLAAGDIVLLPSAREGLALVLYEAMAMRTVPVAAAVGGQAELVTPDCGYLVAQGPDEVEAYVTALQELIRDGERRTQMAARCRNRVVAEFGIERMAQGMDAIFTRALQRAAARSSEPSAVSEQISEIQADMVAAIEPLRHSMAMQMRLAQPQGLRLDDYARYLRQRYLPFGSVRYERYKQARRAVTGALRDGMRVAAMGRRFLLGAMRATTDARDGSYASAEPMEGHPDGKGGSQHARMASLRTVRGDKPEGHEDT